MKRLFCKAICLVANQTHFLDLDLNDQKTRRYFRQWFHISKNKRKLKYEREKKNPVSRFGNNPTYPLLPTWTEPEAL